MFNCPLCKCNFSLDGHKPILLPMCKHTICLRCFNEAVARRHLNLAVCGLCSTIIASDKAIVNVMFDQLARDYGNTASCGIHNKSLVKLDDVNEMMCTDCYLDTLQRDAVSSQKSQNPQQGAQSYTMTYGSKLTCSRIDLVLSNKDISTENYTTKVGSFLKTIKEKEVNEILNITKIFAELELALRRQKAHLIYGVYHANAGALNTYHNDNYWRDTFLTSLDHKSHVLSDINNDSFFEAYRLCKSQLSQPQLHNILSHYLTLAASNSKLNSHLLTIMLETQLALLVNTEL
jgi:hypothetical protein